ncbi:MAG: Cna B-type domain-containing protein [Lachnospiraceae bacterium]|nr:Cna B-type domain-containing protein [Lachnospiraceae bacterium]
MGKRKNWLKTTIAMISIIAMVLETGFSSVATVYASDLIGGGDVVESNLDADELTDAGSLNDSDTVDININPEKDFDDEDQDNTEDVDVDAPAGEEASEGTLDVSDSGITGSEYDVFSFYIDTEGLANEDSFNVKFSGPDSASYNPVLNNDLDKLNDGQYDITGLNGDGFSIRATGTANVILSYKDNVNGLPGIVVESKPAEKVLETKVLTAVDDSRISAVSGSGYDSIKLSFDTEDLTDKDAFTLIVESKADPTVNGSDARGGIEGLTKADTSLTIEELGGEEFVAYVVSGTDAELEATAEVKSVVDGEAVIDINGVATKRVYEYEDSDVYVRATLEEADAIPDDAYFYVAPLSEEEAAKYLEVLNSNRDEETPEYTSENTLLYDISFYTDETMSEVIEPEEGSVSVSIEFKKNQVSEDLGVEDKADIEVTHFIEEGSSIEAESLQVSQYGDVDTVEVETDSFSKFAITGSFYKEIDVKDPGAEDTKALLDDAWLYGITANKWMFNGEAETSFAVKKLTGVDGNGNEVALNGGQTGVTTKVAEGSNDQYSMVAEINGNTRIKGYPVQLTIPQNQQSKITHETSGFLTFITANASDIEKSVTNMLNFFKGTGTQDGVSARLSKLDSIPDYSKVPGTANAHKLTLDITSAAGGTYYINVDKYPALYEAFNETGALTIKKNANQKLVFNFGSTNVTLRKFMVQQGNSTLGSDDIANMSNKKNPIVEDLIFNMYRAETVEVDNFAGILIAPYAAVKFTTVAGGWLVCDTAISGAEWHFVNGHIPPPCKTKLKLEIPVQKYFENGQGQWKNDFTFKLVKMKNGGKEVDDTWTPRYITLNGGDTENAEGKFTLEYDDVQSLSFTHNDGPFYTNYTDVHEEWFRISEENIGARSDVEYNIYPDSDQYGKNSPYWFVHVFIYRMNWNHNMVTIKFRTARKDLNGYDWTKGIPCVESQPVYFKNKYKPVETEVVLEGLKKINGSDQDIPDGKFAFTLYGYKDRYSGFNSVIEQDVYNIGNSIKFSPLTLKMGTGTTNETNKSIWYFLIKETQCASPYTKDESQFIAKVTAVRNNNKITTSVKYYKFEKGQTPAITSTGDGSAFEFNCTKFKFNNTYSTSGETVIYGIKMLEGREFDPTDTFTFTLSKMEGNNTTLLQTKTFTVGQVQTAGFNFAFDKLTYGKADDGKTYTYIVKETAGSITGMSYDTNSYPVTVTISDANKNGTLDITQDYGTQANPVKITNHYTNGVPIYVNKVYPVETKLSKNAKFEFHLEGGKVDSNGNIDKTERHYLSMNKEITGPGRALFTDLRFVKNNTVSNNIVNDIGVYKYTINEVIPTGATAHPTDPDKMVKDGIIYDARIYNITITVSENNGRLVVKKTGDYGDGQQSEITGDIAPDFINDYKVNEVKDPIRGKKKFPNREIKEGQFEFVLEADKNDATTVQAIKDGKVVLPSATHVFNGVPNTKYKVNEFGFEDITYYAEGTYKFIVSEVKGNDPNIIYSNATFPITKVVKDNGNGQLEVNETKGLPIVIVNTDWTPGSTQLRAYKELKGKKLYKDEFEFQLLDENGNLIESKKIDANGIALFSKIEYKLPQLNGSDSRVFTYYIKEVIPPGAEPLNDGSGNYKLNGITYDGHTETVNVTVTKVVDSVGNISLNVVPDNGTETDKAVFINEYVATGSDSFGGFKNIIGRKYISPDDDNKWQAVLYDDKDQVVQKADIVKDTKLFADGGTFKFAPLEYSTKVIDPQDGSITYVDYSTPVTYEFSVKEEEVVKVPNINSSKVIYKVKVTVFDNGDGTLSVTHQKFREDGSPVTDLVFDNEYADENSVRFHGLKIVNGSVLEDKMFTFELYNDEVSTTEPIQTAKNDDGGEIWFKPITYVKNDKKDDTRVEPYIYRIKETIENKAGWTYATEEYTVKVWVTFDEDTKKVNVEHHYYKPDANGNLVQVPDSATITFENTYTTVGYFEPYAEKVVTDREVPAGLFKFILTAKDGTTYEAYNEYAPVGKTARANFERIYFDLDSLKAPDVVPDENNDKSKTKKYYKYYTLEEDIPNGAVDLNNGFFKKDGYTYDGRLHIVKVTLEENGKGVIDTDWCAYVESTVLQKKTVWQNITSFFTGKDPRKDVLFTNRYDAQGALIVNALKVLEGKELKAGDFSFTLKGKDENGKDFEMTESNAADGTVSFNRIDFTKPGNYVYSIKEEIPQGAVEEPAGSGIWVKDGIKYDSTEYTFDVYVNDTNHGDLAVIAEINGRSIVESYTTDANGIKVATIGGEKLKFTNTYTPKPVTVTPGGRKDLQGRLLLDGEFEFNMYSDPGNPKDYEDHKVNQGQWFTFKDITFTADDMVEGKGYADKKTFAYTMTETKGSLNGVSYSTAEYKFVIEVTDNNGQLEARVIRDDSWFKGVVPQNEIGTFYNTYEANGTISFPVHKIVLGASEVNKDKEFKFVLVDEQTQDEHYAFCKADEVKTIASFKYELEDLPLNPDGSRGSRVYKYNVHEEVPAADGEGWVYCRDTYYAVVTVSDNGDGTLKVEPQVTFKGKPYTKKELDFINEYDAKGSTDLVGKKVFDYGNLKGDDFEFILEEKTGVDANGNAVYKELERTRNDINGNFSFSDRYYTMDDIDKTFIYRVREDSENGDPTIDYDNAVYDVAISVSDNGDGTLNVKKVVTCGGTVVKNCIFFYHNKKQVLPNSVQIEAEKELQGLPLEDNMFTFELLEGTKSLAKVSNTGTKVTFPRIDYTLADVGSTHEYSVREIIVNRITGVKYDDTVKKVVVKVDLVGNQVTVDRKNYDHTGKQINDDAIKFINEYHATVNVPLGGSKILSGFPDDAPSIGKYPYTFALYKSSDLKNALQTVSVTPKDNKTPAAYKFNDLVFTEEDYNNPNNPQHIFEYTVKEVIPTIEKDKAPNVTYALNEYNVVVKLSIDNKKVLHADAVTKQNVPVDKLDFTNIYKADGSITFQGVKHITGKELEDAAYTFTLTGEGQNQTVTNSGSQITFAPIQYTANDLGLHVYTIQETAAKDGSTIDTRVYTAEVTVSEGSNGKLEVSDPAVIYTMVNGKKVYVNPGEPIPFENTYEAVGEIGIDGIKIMHSKPLAQGDFTFVLKDENGKEIESVTHGAAALNNKKDLEARAAFAFTNLKFTQEDLKISGGYLKELKKYYTVEEQIGTKGGVKYSNAAYVVEVTIKDNGDGTLTVTKNVAGQDGVQKASGGVAGFLKSLIGKMSGKADKIIFENEYDSECVIDPPILTKQMFGRELERGMFKFEITGPGLRSRNESEYKYTAYNGYSDYATQNTLFPWGTEMEVGEVFPGDIKYKFIDLDIDLTTGEASRIFEYYAQEVDNSKEYPDIEFSDQKLKLVVKVYDNNDGTLTIKNAKDLVVNDNKNDPEHKLFWEAVNPYKLNDEEIKDAFLNTDNTEASIDLPGIKRMVGRELTKDDKFKFTITDDKTGKSATVESTLDKDGKPTVVAFNAKDIDFLNYRHGAYAKDPNYKKGDPVDLYWVDDTGDYTYTIKEEALTDNTIIYDATTYKVKVRVELEVDANGKAVKDSKGHQKLVAYITGVDKIYSDNNKVAYDFSGANKFDFVNEFKAKGSIELEGIKYLINKEDQESMENEFEFAIHEYDDASRTSGKKFITSAKTDAEGHFVLQLPEYDQDVLKNEKGGYDKSKTLYYRITETKPSTGVWTENNTVFASNGIVYDNTEYDLDITITNDGTNKLVVTKEITEAATGAMVTEISYSNTKSVEYTTISGKKSWVDDVKDPDTRPDVLIKLYSSAVNNGKTDINDYTIKAPELEYTFTTDRKGDELPKYDSNGKLIKYSVTEEPIPGYVSEQNGYDFTNTKGHIVVQKLDSVSTEPLEGAVLAIYDGKTEIEKWTTGKSAHIVTATLTPGKSYILRELKAPSGYDVAEDITFTVPSDGSDLTLTMNDPPIVGSVKLIKMDRATRKKLAGAEFALYDNNDTRIYATGSAGSYKATTQTSNGVFVVNASGELEITDLPYGAYYFKETKAPEGYQLSDEKHGFTIASSEKQVEVTVLNTAAIGAVKLRKVSSEGSRNPLAGAEFELYSSKPRSAAQAVSSTIFPNAYYRYGTYTTNSSGEIYVEDLPWDDYYFIEVKAPDGYEIQTDVGGDPLVYTFTVDASTSGKTIDLGEILNDPKKEGGVLGERVDKGVLGVRSAPKGGVLGTRVGPATGDASAIALWMALLLACVGTIVWMLASKRKKSTE